MGYAQKRVNKSVSLSWFHSFSSSMAPDAAPAFRRLGYHTTDHAVEQLFIQGAAVHQPGNCFLCIQWNILAAIPETGQVDSAVREKFFDGRPVLRGGNDYDAFAHSDSIRDKFADTLCRESVAFIELHKMVEAG
jgi:hypothetical protein